MNPGAIRVDGHRGVREPLTSTGYHGGWHFSPALRKVDGNLPWLPSITKGGWLKNSAKMKDGI